MNNTLFTLHDLSRTHGRSACIPSNFSCTSKCKLPKFVTSCHSLHWKFRDTWGFGTNLQVGGWPEGHSWSMLQGWVSQGWDFQASREELHSLRDISTTNIEVFGAVSESIFWERPQDNSKWIKFGDATIILRNDAGFIFPLLSRRKRLRESTSQLFCFLVVFNNHVHFDSLAFSSMSKTWSFHRDRMCCQSPIFSVISVQKCRWSACFWTRRESLFTNFFKF